MKNTFIFIVSLIFLTGCAQNVALLGPAFSIVKTGGVQQALVSESINYGVKKQTGKNVSEHVVSSLTEEAKLQECKISHSNGLQKIFFNTLDDIDCEKVE